jgi:hypothetical protein
VVSRTKPYSARFFAAELADAVGLVEKVVTVAQRFLCVPVDRNGDRLTVLIYVDTSKQAGDPDHLKVFANADAAETWFEQNDPEGVAFDKNRMRMI